MKKEDLAQLSDEELQKNAKTLKAMTYTLAGALLVLFIINIVLAFKKGFSALNIVPVALLPILIVNFNSLSEIKKELRSRNLS